MLFFCCYITISHIFILLLIIINHNHPPHHHQPWLSHPLVQNKQSWRAKEVISPTFAPILSFVRSSSAPASIFCNSLPKIPPVREVGEMSTTNIDVKMSSEMNIAPWELKMDCNRIDDLKCWYFGFNIDFGFQFIAHPYSLGKPSSTKLDVFLHIV